MDGRYNTERVRGFYHCKPFGVFMSVTFVKCIYDGLFRQNYISKVKNERTTFISQRKR